MIQSRIRVESGLICVAPSIADMLRVRRLGGRFNARMRRWEFAATHENAAALWSAIPFADVAPEFGALLAASRIEAAPERAIDATRVSPDVARVAPQIKAEFPVPAGIRTHPWRHQLAAFEFCMERFERGQRGILLAMGMGCVAGDAEVIVNRGGNARRMTLREFHRKFHGGASNKRRWRKIIARTRSVIGGELRLNTVIDVLARGVRPVVKLTLASGKSIRVTPDHEIAQPDGRWTAAERLVPGDSVLTEEASACAEHGGVHNVPAAEAVLSVCEAGEVDVYDLRMAAPGHNFVANGIIVHNCGKSLVACMVALALKARRVLIAAPLRVLPVWVSQFERHVSAPVLVVPLGDDAGSVAHKMELAREKAALAEARGIPFIAVINYESAWRDPFARWAEKTQWDLVVGDECVPAGTLIATPGGNAPIEKLAPGDEVLGVDNNGRTVAALVRHTFRRITTAPFVQIGSLLATGNHPVWTKRRGYVPAADVRPGDEVLVHEDSHDYLRVVRSVLDEGDLRRRLQTPLLQHFVLGPVEDVPAGLRGAFARETRQGEERGVDEAELAGSGLRGEIALVPELQPQSVLRPGSEGEVEGRAARKGFHDAERREWQRSDGPAEDARGPARLADGGRREDANARGLRVSDELQAGHRGTDAADRRGSGRAEPPFGGPESARPQEGRTPCGAGLDGVAREKRGGAAGLRGGCTPRVVFNIETTTGNYFADGILVHNCHRLKGPGGKASLFFKRLRTRAAHRIALTGTPMPHGPMDVYAQFRFLDISVFGPSFSAFRTRYAVMGGFQRKQITGFQHLDELEAKMSRITFRVGAEVLDLPPAVRVTYTCDLTPEAARICRDLEEDFVARVLDGTVTAANAMVKLLRLQQVTGGCVPTDDGAVHRIDSGKQKLLADTLEDIGGEPVVVFCRFHADLDAVHDACAEMGIPALELSGRRDELKRWQGGEGQVLAVQISAGGIGVDLTRARYSIYYSLSFSLGEYDQALARVHRPGQTRPVEHIHLVARNTVDVKIMRALEKRAEIVQAILAEIKH